MAITLEQKENFIHLRARGLSFEKISQELNISKPTLLKLEREQAEQIEQERALEVQAILEKFSLMRIARVEAFSSLLRSILEELLSRKESLKDMPTDKLLSLAFLLEKRLSPESSFTVKSSLDNFYDRERAFTISVE